MSIVFLCVFSLFSGRAFVLPRVMTAASGRKAEAIRAMRICFLVFPRRFLAKPNTFGIAVCGTHRGRVTLIHTRVGGGRVLGISCGTTAPFETAQSYSHHVLIPTTDERFCSKLNFSSKTVRAQTTGPQQSRHDGQGARSPPLLCGI